MRVARLDVEAVRGDIADQLEVDAVVNAANAHLLPGGGVAGAIHRAAGPGLAEECRPLAPIAPGEAVITGAHDLPNRFVVHVLGPVYGEDRPEAELLASCYRRALALADGRGCVSLASPAVSTGIFGYPLDEATRVALDAVAEEAPALENLRLVRFVLFTERELAVFQEELSRRSW